MKKIPTLFIREFDEHNIVGIRDELSDEKLTLALTGEATPTVKVDGSCCAIIDGVFYKRYDAKRGKKVPKNAIMCQDTADPVTGHLPCWLPVDKDNPADKWYYVAFSNTLSKKPNGTYEAIGPHFNSNPYGLHEDILYPHGSDVIKDDLSSFDKIKHYLETHDVEGIVWWYDNEPLCKIKKTDFGLKWKVTKPRKESIHDNV